MTEPNVVDEDDSSSSASSSADELIPGALNELVSELETKAAKYNLSRSNVKNILKHVMQSEEMVNLLRDELSAEEDRQTSSSSSEIPPVFGASSMRMTRQRFRQLAGDKVCPDLEVLLSRLPTAPSAPKSFFEVEFPEDDPEDSEYDPRLEEEAELDETLASPSLASVATPATCRDDRLSYQTPATESATAAVIDTPTAGQKTNEELIACRTRSRYPLRDFDLDAIAPLPPELRFDGDSMSPTSPIRGHGHPLLSMPGSQRCASPTGSTNPVDDDEVYAHFLATVFDSDESDGNTNNDNETTMRLVSETLSQTDETNVYATTPAPPSANPATVTSATDEEQDDPDYNPFQDIDALLEFDPDEYAWDKRARIPKEEVRSLRKEAFADLPVHCHLLETCAEATAGGVFHNNETGGPSTELDTPPRSARKRPFPASQQKKSARELAMSSTKKTASHQETSSSSSSCESSSASSSSESEDDDDNFTGVQDPALLEEPVDFEQSKVETDEQQHPGEVSMSADFLPTAEQVLVLHEQLRKHIQILVQTYIMAGNAPEASMLSDQSVMFLKELETLRQCSQDPEQSCFNAFNLAPTLEFLEKWPPDAIGSPKARFTELTKIQQQRENNKKRRVDRLFLLRPKLSNRQLDLMVFHCSALLYSGLLPTSNDGFLDAKVDAGQSKRVPWLPSEDDLLALGLEQFWQVGKPFRDKAVVIHQYLLPTKNPLNIRMRMKNVFYSAQYENDMNNPIKIFQRYGVAPQYESIVCNFCAEEVVPLRFLPRRCLPCWFAGRLSYWEHKSKSLFVMGKGEALYLADQNEEDENRDENSLPSTSQLSRNSSGVNNNDNNRGEDDEIEFPRGTASSYSGSDNDSSSSSNDDETDPNNVIPSTTVTQGDPTTTTATATIDSGSNKPVPIIGDDALVTAEPTNSNNNEEEPLIVMMEATSSVSLPKEAGLSSHNDDDLTSSSLKAMMTPPRQQQTTAQQQSPSFSSFSSSSEDEEVTPMEVEEDDDDSSLDDTLSVSRFNADTLNTPNKKQQTVQSSPSVGHGGLSSVDEEAAVFLTPVKNYVTNRRQFDSDPRAITDPRAAIDASSSDSVPANQRLSTAPKQTASPLRARQPLLAKLLASLTPRAQQQESITPAKQESSLIAVVIAPVSSSTPSASTNVSPAMVRQKRVRRASARAESEVENKKLLKIAPATVVNPPPKSLLDASELSAISQALPSPSKNANKVVESIRARALKQSRFAAVKRSLQMGTSGNNSNANPPQFDSDSYDAPAAKIATTDENMVTSSQLENAAVPQPVRRRPTAVRRRHPPRLNEKQRQRLVDMFTASNSARMASNSTVDCEKTGPVLPISGLVAGTNLSSGVVETEFANSYLELLESSVPFPVFFDILKLFESCHENQHLVDVKFLYDGLKNLLAPLQRLDLLSSFACFLTARQAYDCGCYQNFAEYDAICEFLSQHQAAFGSRVSLKGLQSLTRLISSAKPVNFSAMEGELVQILANQTCLLEQMASFFSEDRPSATRFYPESDHFETIDFTSNEVLPNSSHLIDFENFQLPASFGKYGTSSCPCDCHTSGVANIRVSTIAAAQLADFKRHCRHCGISVTDGKLYLPDSRTGFRLKRVAVLSDKFQQLLKPYIDAPKKATEAAPSSSSNVEQQQQIQE